MDPLYFDTKEDFRSWLETHYNKEKELIVGFYKKSSGKPSMTWSESVDQALCFGWIDGVRNSIDENRYCIRFTPRKANSNWSKVNVEKVEVLKKAGLMNEAGLKAYSLIAKNKSKVYSYEQRIVKLSIALEQIFKRNKTAWSFFTTQAPSYQKTIIHWIMSAKKEETKLSRLEKTIQVSQDQKRMK